MRLGRVDEAAATLQQAKARHIDSSNLHLDAYLLAWAKGDGEAMAREVAWGAGKPGVEDRFLNMQSARAASAGQFAQANELTARAIASAQQAGEKETAGGYQAVLALREARVGDFAQARSQAAQALKMSRSIDTEGPAALALALSGDVAQAQELADDLAKRFPEDTRVQSFELPAIRALVALDQHAPAKAIADLQAASPFQTASSLGLQLAYLRGLAYLEAHQGAAAASQFQNILDQPGVATGLSPGVPALLAPLAHLGLARARVLTGDKPGARKAYQDLLALWQHADPGIPVLRQAKSEYAKLQ